MDDRDCASLELFCFNSICEEVCFESSGDGEVGSPCFEDAACNSENCDNADRSSSCECLLGTGDRTFFDDTFLEAAWSTEIVEGRSMGMNSFEVRQEPSGGNTGDDPDEYRGLTLTIGEGQVALWLLNLKEDATWNPADGAICGLSAQLDGTDKDAGTAETLYSMAFRQGGRVFWSELFHVYVDGWLTMSPKNEDDFKLFDPLSDPVEPEFSRAGAPIEFGFLAGAGTNNTTGASRTFQYGVDNWRFVVDLCPE